MSIQHFFAFLSPLALLAYWLIIGYATLVLLHTQRNTLQNILLAPAVGLAITILSLFTLSWFGFPVKTIAWPVFGIPLCLSILILYCKKPLFTWKKYLPFLGISFLALYITGRPLLHFGFSWLSYINDDMLNYSLAAVRFLNHGYFDIPSVQSMTNGKDYGIFYWFMHVPGLMRPGSELLLAWVSALTHISPERIFMPVMLSLHCAIIHTIARLNYSTRKHYSFAFLSAFLYTTAAMASLGIFYQLIAQTDGLVLLIATIAFLFKKAIPHFKYAILRYSILSSILLAALAICYPELSSLFILSTLLYFGRLLIKKEFPVKQFFTLSILIGGITAFFLHGYLFNFFTTLLSQTGHANQTVTTATSIFPYFLVPSGLANLWGFQALAALPLEPWLSGSILVGAFLLIVTAFWTIYWFWRDGSPAAASLLTILLLTGYFFTKNADFILFKLAMYVQPFLWSALVSGILYSQQLNFGREKNRNESRSVQIVHEETNEIFDKAKNSRAQSIEWFQKRYWITPIILAFIISNLYSEQTYLDRSLGLRWSDIPYASGTDLGKTLDSYFSTDTSHTTVFLSDTPTIVVAKIESLHSRNHSLFFPGRNFYKDIVGFASLQAKMRTEKNADSFSHFVNSSILNASDQLTKHFKTTYQLTDFSLYPENHQKSEDTDKNKFDMLQTKEQNSAQFLLESSSEQSILNRWHRPSPSNHTPIALVPIKEVQNYLIFINSFLGQDYYLADDYSRISLYLLEQDYFYPNQTFSAIGRNFLFEVINPSQQPRLVLDLTTTLNGDKINRLPKAIAIGKKRISFPIIGYGSARVFSPIISPQFIAQHPFVMIDMNENSKYFIQKRKGAMALYGQNFLIDIRKLVGFSRDISMISNTQYEQLATPHSISHFPQDLANQNLEYSGFYEDGWVGQDAYVYLSPTASTNTLKIKGAIPSSPSTITVWIDNKKLTTTSLSSGNFTLNLPIKLAPNKRYCIRLHFSIMLPLPNLDGRPVSAQINTLGFSSL